MEESPAESSSSASAPPTQLDYQAQELFAMGCASSLAEAKGILKVYGTLDRYLRDRFPDEVSSGASLAVQSPSGDNSERKQLILESVKGNPFMAQTYDMLFEAFSHHSPDQVKYAVEYYGGDCNAAADYLSRVAPGESVDDYDYEADLDSPLHQYNDEIAIANKSKTEKNLYELRALFPDFSEEEIGLAFKMTDGRLRSTIASLLDFRKDREKKAKQNEKGKGKEVDIGSGYGDGRKRFGGPVNALTSPKKSKFKVYRDEKDVELQPASEWVKKLSDDKGIRVILDKGEHGCRFTKTVLGGIPGLKAEVDKLREFEDQIRVDNVAQSTFDLAIQYSITKHIKADADIDPSEEINEILSFVTFADNMRLSLNLGDKKSSIMACIKEILVQNRGFLLDCHVDYAYKILKVHRPIQIMFTNSVVQPYYEFRNHDNQYRNDDREDDKPEGAWRDNTQKTVLFTPKFYLHDSLHGIRLIEPFKCDLFDAVDRAWQNRVSEDISKFSNKKQGKIVNEISLTDPLTGESFVVY